MNFKDICDKMCHYCSIKEYKACDAPHVVFKKESRSDCLFDDTVTYLHKNSEDACKFILDRLKFDEANGWTVENLMGSKMQTFAYCVLNKEEIGEDGECITHKIYYATSPIYIPYEV